MTTIPELKGYQVIDISIGQNLTAVLAKADIVQDKINLDEYRNINLKQRNTYCLDRAETLVAKHKEINEESVLNTALKDFELSKGIYENIIGKLTHADVAIEKIRAVGGLNVIKNFGAGKSGF
jgi:hypothetical protein